MTYNELNKWWLENMKIYTENLKKYIDERIKAILDERLNGNNI